jgi:MOSC domain-containing protein YiiM
MPGTVESIHVAPGGGEPAAPIADVHVRAGLGLEGDRYFGSEHADAAITLIEGEVIEAVREQHGIDLRNGRSRRQVTTRGIGLNDLVGRDFAVGGVRCRGVELCEPCRYLTGLLEEPNLIKALVHRGGLRAQVLTDGRIAVGDTVTALDDPAAAVA